MPTGIGCVHVRMCIFSRVHGCHVARLAGHVARLACTLARCAGPCVHVAQQLRDVLRTKHDMLRTKRDDLRAVAGMSEGGRSRGSAIKRPSDDFLVGV